MHKDFFERITHINHNITRRLLPFYLRGENTCYSYDVCDHKSNKNSKTKACNDDILPYALDRQAQAFLSQYYNVSIDSASTLELYLALWNYESLIHSIGHAQEHSFAYKEKLCIISCKDLLNDFHEKYGKYISKNVGENTGENTFEYTVFGNAHCSSENTVLEKTHCSDTINIVHEIRLLSQNLLERIPCTIDTEIVSHSEAFLAVNHDDIYGLISVETSGTTSQFQKASQAQKTLQAQNILQDIQDKKPISPSPAMSKKRIYCSASDLQSTIDFFFYGMQYMLRKDNNNVALLMSGERQGSVGHLLKEAMDTLGVDCRIFGFPQDKEEMFQALLEYKPTCIIGVPGHILLLSDYAKNTELQDNLDCVLLSGDSLTANMRQRIAQNLSCDVFVHYGLTETGLGGAVECKEHNGLHMRQLDLHVEIVDENLQVLPNGIAGEIVITTLTRQAMPLIRYRTGDLGMLLSGMCTCGSVFQRLEVQGRMQQAITLQGKGFVHITAFQEFFYGYSNIIDFELCIFTDEQYAHSCLLIAVDFNASSNLDSSDFDSSDFDSSDFTSHVDCSTVLEYITILKEDFSREFALPHASSCISPEMSHGIPPEISHGIPPEMSHGISLDSLPHAQSSFLIDRNKKNFQKMPLKKNTNTDIVNFHICTMNTYRNFIAQKTQNIVSKTSPLKHGGRISASKKGIQYIRGSLCDLYGIGI